MSSKKSLFVAGTDTGVGKTVVTAGIATWVRERGLDVGVFKPVQSGNYLDDPAGDAYYLWKMSGVADALNEINRYAFAAPLAPSVAAELENSRVSVSAVEEAYRNLASRHEGLLVEGAGGLLVPLNGETLVVDLIAKLELPVLLVGRLGLGTINHTLLSLEALARRDIPVAGVVFHRSVSEPDEASPRNPDLLRALSEAPFWGVVDFIPNLWDRASLVRETERGIGGALRDYFFTEER